MQRGPGKRAVIPSKKATNSEPVTKVPRAVAGKQRNSRPAVAAGESKDVIIDGTFSKLQKAELVARAIACSKHKEFWAGKSSLLTSISHRLQCVAVENLAREQRELWLAWTTGTTRKTPSGTEEIVGAHSSWFCWPRDLENRTHAVSLVPPCLAFLISFHGCVCRSNVSTGPCDRVIE
jgi:hypothetical protein